MFLPATFLLPIALLASSATAEDTLVGKEAPEFSIEGCLNEPRLFESAELRGEVILLKIWGTT